MKASLQGKYTYIYLYTLLQFEFPPYALLES